MSKSNVFSYVQLKVKGGRRRKSWKSKEKTRSTQRGHLKPSLSLWTFLQPLVSLILFFHQPIKFSNTVDSEMIKSQITFKKMTLSPDRSLPKSNTGSEGTSGSGTVRVSPGCVLPPECEDVVHSSSMPPTTQLHTLLFLHHFFYSRCITWSLNIWSANCRFQCVVKGRPE